MYLFLNNFTEVVTDQNMWYLTSYVYNSNQIIVNISKAVSYGMGRSVLVLTADEDTCFNNTPESDAEASITRWGQISSNVHWRMARWRIFFFFSSWFEESKTEGYVTEQEKKDSDD